MNDVAQTEIPAGGDAQPQESTPGDEPPSVAVEGLPQPGTGAEAAAPSVFGDPDDADPASRAGTMSAAEGPTHSVEFLRSVEVQASVELGRVVLPIGEVLGLAPGSVVHLDKMLGDPVDLMIKDKLVARGEVVVVDDTFGLRITEIVSSGSDVAGRDSD